jgi:hypothetical protein
MAVGETAQAHSDLPVVWAAHNLNASKRCKVKVPSVRGPAKTADERSELLAERRRARALRKRILRVRGCLGRKNPFGSRSNPPRGVGGPPPAADQYLPWANGVAHYVTQGNNSWRYSHQPTNPFTRWGWDFGLSDGEEVRAPIAGEVVGFEDRCARTVVIPSPSANCGNQWGNYVLVKVADGTCMRFGHLVSVAVRPPARVARYDVVGAAGSSGASTGTHLHYQREQCGGPGVPSTFFEPNVVEDGSPRSQNAAEPPPEPPEPPPGPQPGQTFVVDNSDPGFTQTTPLGTEDRWRSWSEPSAVNGQALYRYRWLPSRGDRPEQSGSATWAIDLPPGKYESFAHIPANIPHNANSDTNGGPLRAQYIIHALDGNFERLEDQHWMSLPEQQAKYGGWTDLALYKFNGRAAITLTDNARETDQNMKYIAYDAVRFVYAGPLE